jgi:hypothetical protein
MNPAVSLPPLPSTREDILRTAPTYVPRLKLKTPRTANDHKIDLFMSAHDSMISSLAFQQNLLLGKDMKIISMLAVKGAASKANPRPTLDRINFNQKSLSAQNVKSIEDLLKELQVKKGPPPPPCVTHDLSDELFGIEPTSFLFSNSKKEKPVVEKERLERIEPLACQPPPPLFGL